MRAHVLNPSPTETAIWGELSTKCLGKTPQKLAQCRIWDTKKAKSNQDCPPNVSQKKKICKSLLSAESAKQRKKTVIRTVHQISGEKKKSLLMTESGTQRKRRVIRTVYQISRKNSTKSLLMAESGTRRKRRVTRSVTKFQFIDQLSVCCPVCGGVARKRAP